jgi:hypothetical protein
MAAALAGVVGCSAPSPSPTVAPTASYGPVETTVTDGMFRLTARADQANYHTHDAIGMVALVTFLGPAPNFPATGSGSGLVTFDVQQVDGPLVIHGVTPLDCIPQPLLVANEPQAIPFAKSGGYDPSASPDFWNAYFADPLLHLPAGHWSLVARADITGVECDPSTLHHLMASVEVTVLP